MKTFQQFCEDVASQEDQKKNATQSQQETSQNYELKRAAAAERQQAQVAQVQSNINRQREASEFARQKRIKDIEHENELKQLKKDIRKDVEDEVIENK